MNLFIIKLILLMASSPIWLPFMKALWEELNDAMRPDGGLFGDPPGAAKRAEIEREIERERPRLVHETIAHWNARRDRGDMRDVEND